MNLRYDRKTTVSPRPSRPFVSFLDTLKGAQFSSLLVAAPTPAPKAAPPVQKTIKKTKGKGKQRQPADDLDRDLGLEPINSKPIVRKEAEQKKEPIKKKEPVQKEKKTKSLPNTTPAPSKSASYADEEVIEFARPTKRPRQSTPQRAMLPPSPVTLSLPGGSNSFAPPPPPPGSHNSRGTGSSSRDIPPPPAPAALSLPISVPASPPMMGQYSDEEEDWDEVSTANLASASMAPSKSNSNVDDNPGTYDLALEQDIFGDVFEEVDGDDDVMMTTQQSYADGGDGEEEEIDMNAFEQELNEHMEVVDDDSDSEVFGNVELEEPDLQGGGGGTRQPISLNRLASGGAGMEMSEEEYSSSDSDED